MKRDGSESRANGDCSVEKKNGRNQIKIRLNTNAYDGNDRDDYNSEAKTNKTKARNKYVYNLVGTLVHETFMHGYYNTGDILDGWN